MTLPTDDKARKALPLWTFLTEYFLKAWIAVANVAIKGNEQHNPGEPLHWAREKSTDQMNTAFRHQLDYAMGVKKDTDGQWHLAKAIWRLSAQLQLDIEHDERETAAAPEHDPNRYCHICRAPAIGVVMTESSFDPIQVCELHTGVFNGKYTRR